MFIMLTLLDLFFLISRFVLSLKTKFPNSFWREYNWRESSWTGCHAFHEIFNTRDSRSLALQTRIHSKTARARNWTMPPTIIIFPIIVWKLIFSRRMLIDRVQFQNSIWISSKGLKIYINRLRVVYFRHVK